MDMSLNISVEEILSFLAHRGTPTERGPARARPDGPTIKMSRSVRQDILREIGERDPETGGVLIGPTNEQIATHFIFDKTGICTGTSWTFGHVHLNEILRKYVPLGLDAKGYVHSHPPGYRQLSAGDLLIPQKAFANAKNEDLNEVWLPILVDGEILPFIVYRSKPTKPELAQLVLI